MNKDKITTMVKLDQQMERSSLEQYITQYGNRTSSFNCFHDQFKSLLVEGIGENQENFLMQYIETDKSIIIASEPFGEQTLRSEAILKLKNNFKSEKKRITIFPVGNELKDQLTKSGMKAHQVGLNPVFILSDYFKENSKEAEFENFDVLDYYPIAKTLKRRGAVVELHKFGDFSSTDIDFMKQEIDYFMFSKKIKAFNFLSKITSFDNPQLKKYFTIKHRDELLAFLVAVPIHDNNIIKGYYFSDCIRTQKYKSGAMDLLFIEAMRILHEQEIAEVHLGMSALAGINPKSTLEKFFKLLFEKFSFGHSFKGNYQFKKKLNPSFWEPLYLVTNTQNIFSVLYDIKKALTIDHPINVNKNPAFLNNWFTLRAEYQNIFTYSQAFSLSKIRFTLLTVTLCTLAHFIDPLKNLIYFYYYNINQLTFSGTILGPFFHYHNYHLFGDMLSLLIFGAIVEWTAGPLIYFLVFGLGMWLANPLTHLFLLPFLQYIPHEWMEVLNRFRDNGTSNGVYALMAFVSWPLKSRFWILIPFMINGLIILVGNTNLLALHHYAGLLVGLVCLILYKKYKKMPS